MSERDETVYLRHILDSIERIESHLAGVSRPVFLEDTLRQDAVIRQLAVIGEAVKRLSQDLRDQDTTVPWRDIAGMRDRLIHDYMSVDAEEVWRTADVDIPELKASVLSILDRLGPHID